MNDWQTVTLEDVMESINTGLDAIRRAPIVEHKTNLRCLRIQDISQNKPFDKWGYTEVKDSDFKKFQLVPNDIIMARTCSTGICYLVKKELPAVFNNGLARIRLKIEKVDPKFIYYVFKSKHFSGYIDGISGGTSVQLNMKIGDLLKYQFNLPPLSEQKEIARILSDLDKKIELNTQINQTLEQIAQALFKSWFIDFDPVRAKVQALSGGLSLEQAELAAMQTISGKTAEELTALLQEQPDRYAELAETAKAFPCEMVEVDGVEMPKGWTFQYLKDVCNIVYGKGLPKTKLTNTGYRVFGANGVIGYYSEFMYKNPQILIGCRGTVGQVTVSTPFSFITNNSLIIEYENSLINRYYLEHYLRTLNLKEISSGSVQPQITIQNMSGVKLLTPNRETLLLYEINVKDIYETMYQNQIENEKLTKVRDLLLPKLLNGEIE